MLIMRDLYTQVETSNLESSGTPIGQINIQYEVRAYTDTRNLTQVKSYLVTCTQRLILPNPTPYAAHSVTTTSFIQYPALIASNIAITDPGNIMLSIGLLDYTPRTLNTAVATNQATSQVNDVTVSQQYTAGSSTAQTNSYGISVSAGFFGDLPTGDISASSQTSNTTERSSSVGRGTAVDRGNQLSNSSSMTIKDWGSYASVDAANRSPTWVWGQEYPWNVIQLKNVDASGNVLLPAYVTQRLYDGTQVYPPSELSMFGVDFVCKAAWLITPSAPEAGAEQITFTHTLTYSAASHRLLGGELVANLDTFQPITYTSSSLDLAVLALDPILSTDRSAAIIGFVPNQFDVPPGSGGVPFSITAESNNLLVRGSGFTAIMSTDFSAGAVQMDVYVKVLDATSDVSLSLKHWVLNAAACKLSIVVNGNSDATLTKFVDAPEAGSGGDNVMVIALRRKDFASVDYCDYLQLGLNTISITFSPVNTDAATVYQLLAMAVG